MRYVAQSVVAMSCFVSIINSTNVPFLICLTYRNLDEGAMAVTDNHPYLGVVVGDASIEVYLVVQRRVMEKVEASSLVTELIAAYFAFNMSSPN